MKRQGWLYQHHPLLYCEYILKEIILVLTSIKLMLGRQKPIEKCACALSQIS